MNRRDFSFLSLTGALGALFSKKSATAETLVPPPASPLPPLVEEKWKMLTCQNSDCKSSFKISADQTGYPVCPRCGSGWIEDLVLVRPAEFISMGTMLKALRKDQLADGGPLAKGTPLKMRNYDHNYERIRDDA